MSIFDWRRDMATSLCYVGVAFAIAWVVVSAFPIEIYKDVNGTRISTRVECQKP